MHAVLLPPAIARSGDGAHTASRDYRVGSEVRRQAWGAQHGTQWARRHIQPLRRGGAALVGRLHGLSTEALGVRGDGSLLRGSIRWGTDLPRGFRGRFGG